MNKSGSFLILKSISTLLILCTAGWMFSQSALDPISSAIYTQMNGERSASDQIVLVTLDDMDIESLGGWPISRDYYAYMIHALSASGAKTIGLDFLFNDTDSLFLEYDQALAGFIRSSDRIVLPAIVQSDGEILLPALLFREHTALGFSNLGEESPVHHSPLSIPRDDSHLFSFGFELARHYLDITEKPIVEGNRIILTQTDGTCLYIPVDGEGDFRPSYFGGLNQVKTIGFVELLQTFQSAPDSLYLNGKLVLVAPTAQTLPVIKQLPKFGTVPGSLIHLTVAENIITGNLVRSVPKIVLWIIGSLMTLFLLWSIWTRQYWSSILLLSVFCVSWLLPGLLLYTFATILLPLTPFFFALFGLICLTSLSLLSRYSVQKSQNVFLEQEIEQTRTELNRTQSEKQTSEEEKDQAVLRLEKHLRDLEAIRLPDVSMNSRFGEIIHAPNSPLVEILKQVHTVGPNTIAVLILGETGTGKELIARAIHKSSKRNDREFLVVNCGALSENLLESELFGHEKGSFTGAHIRRIGRFEQAHGGTLFLDEISETSPAFQARLLRVLQEGLFERVGGQQPIQTDVRIIAATNRDLKAEVDASRFRADLYFRLNGFLIQLPQLQDRKMDIPLLVHHFLDRYAKDQIQSLSQAALDRLQKYDWPGNVRELENCVRRAAILAASRGHDQISVEDFSDEMEMKSESDAPAVSYLPLEEQILSMLRSYKFSHSAITQTAHALGNRDRGTITEYFRGICFQILVTNEFNLKEAVNEIAGTDDQKIIAQVENKFGSYLENVSSITPSDLNKESLPATFQGLPKQFHTFLKQIIQHKDRIV
ncbi:sigma 54-interacting transcriptional regulator [candidate division KSB1 bacterium]|nr:sigma 54-interacting transcriptional regulator [candidate division KSB1 bacterium]